MSRSEEVADRWMDRLPGTLAAALAALTVCGVSSAALAQEPVVVPSDQSSVILEADTLVNDEPNQTITAEGNVEVRYKGRTLRTKRLIYNLKDNSIRAQGGVQIIDPDGTVRYAEEFEVDDELNTGFATKFGARIKGGGTASAQSAVRVVEGRNELRRVIYTACPVCETKPDGSKTGAPTWTLRARRAVQDQNSKMISYRDVVLQVGSVPIVYLPYFSHPDPSSGPRSGFMAPSLGANRRLGTYYQQPYYWRISPSQDLTIAPRVHENVNPLIELEYRKRFYSGQMNLAASFAYDQDFTGDGTKFGDKNIRGHVFGDGQFRVDDFWSWGFGIERASDDLYLRRYDIDGEAKQRGPYVGDGFRLITQVYGTGQSENTYSNLALVYSQGLRAVDDTQSLPLILPVGEYEHVLRDPLLDGTLKLQASTVSLTRGKGFGDQTRVSVGADWARRRVLGPGLVVEPFMQARQDVYRQDDYTVPTQNGTLSRAVAIAGVEVRYPFVRPGKSMDVIVEPIALAAIGTGSDRDDDIVNEDANAFELDESNVFRPNAAPNYDLWEPAGRAAVGVQATARAHNGAYGSVAVGRRWRDSPYSKFGPPATTTTGNDSLNDYVGSVRASLGPKLSSEVRFRVDEKDMSLQRVDAAIKSSIWRITADARYFKLSDAPVTPGSPNQEIRATVGYQLTKHWSVSYTVQRDLDSDINRYQNARLTYRDDCTFLDLAYSRQDTVDRVLGPDEGFQIRVGLTTLGVFGG